MSAFPAALGSAPPIAGFDDDAWEDLLNFVEEKRVIPIVGPELASIRTDRGTENLYGWLARSLAARLGLPVEPDHAPTLNDVVVRHLANRGRREDVYTRIRTIMREATFAPPPALLKLAEIADFNLYVSTTFDRHKETGGLRHARRHGCHRGIAGRRAVCRMGALDSGRSRHPTDRTRLENHRRRTGQTAQFHGFADAVK